MRVIGEVELKAAVDEIRGRWPVVGLAVGVVRDCSLEFVGGGLADIASDTPVSEDTVFRIGSVTKTFTGIAVMQLEEEGLIELDAPANAYLRSYRLTPAKADWRPATVRHLLTHTAGSVRFYIHPGCFECAISAKQWRWDARYRPWPSSTEGGCASRPSRAPGSCTPIMGSPRSARSSKT